MFKLPFCPFCGLEIKYLESFVCKNKSTFKCNSCKNISNVFLKDLIYKILWIVQIVLIIIFIYSILFEEKFLIISAILINFIFILFYSITPLMVFLEEKEICKSPFDKI